VRKESIVGVIISRQTGANRVDWDLGKLALPDGRLCHQLSGSDLWKALKALKIPGITPHMGSQELMIAYCDYKAASAK